MATNPTAAQYYRYYGTTSPSTSNATKSMNNVLKASGLGNSSGSAGSELTPNVTSGYAAAPKTTTSSASSSSAQESANALLDYYNSLLAQQQAQRQAAYNNTVAQQKKNYEYNVGQVNNSADNALKQAYINRMQNQRTMQQNLAAQGLSGGASETTLGNLLNAYSNSRNNIETNRTSNIADLGNTYANNLANASNILTTGNANDMQAYGTNLATMAASNPLLLKSLKQSNAGNATTNYADMENENLTYKAMLRALGYEV